MKKLVTSSVLATFLLSITQTAYGVEPSGDIDLGVESDEISVRATLRYHFKSIPPLKYKGKVRIDYYPYDGGYTRVYL